MMKQIDQSLLEAAKPGQFVICILRDDTDVFVLLAYWVNQANLQCKLRPTLTAKKCRCTEYYGIRNLPTFLVIYAILILH